MMVGVLCWLVFHAGIPCRLARYVVWYSILKSILCWLLYVGLTYMRTTVLVPFVSRFSWLQYAGCLTSILHYLVPTDLYSVLSGTEVPTLSLLWPEQEEILSMDPVSGCQLFRQLLLVMSDVSVVFGQEHPTERFQFINM